MGIIYKITNPTGRIYIGKTLNLRKRINCHKHASKKSATGIMLHNSIRKYGWDAHKLEVVEEIDNELLNEREVFWIKELNTCRENNSNGMNMTVGGDGNKGTWMDRLDLREKQSKLFTGKGNPFYGKTHTDAIKKELSEMAIIRNRLDGRQIPKWGADKGRLKVIRAVICYGNDGEFIGEYESLTNAAKSLGINICGVKESLKYGSWHIGLYMFKYKTDNYCKKIIVGKIKMQSVKRPVLYFIGNNVLEYPSSLEASIELRLPKASVNRAALNNLGKPLRTGHIFIYKDLYEKMRQEALN